ncbi:hypothetical protein Poli38472_010120 [Pythium oligandrum]|uniref:Uncharacterized protein n=1 Tax=Pythium oligandrum TaxID=41045 RepID=A0A8K1FDN6_PYTOL|nr:hypothetical protein Poli38472_010120 [Pythium oligandrum]|eukprot:TMW58561.1 hypothetical protein Poli38472_010120 [Pythium oligandrum]
MIVVVDIILEFGLSVGVTLSVILPYVLLFSWSAGRFPDPYGYDDVWLANLLSELRQALVSSKMDYASSMFPHIMMLMGTDILESILRRGTSTSVTPAPDSIVAPLSNSRRRSSLMDFFPRTSSITPPRVSKRLHRVLHVLELLAIGFAATRVYLHYRTHSVATSHPIQGCGLHMYPWFAVNFSCAVIQINCYRIKSVGTEQDMIKELDGLERGVLTKLIFSHCPALEVPPIVTEFSHLQVLETFNCSIVKWEAPIRHSQQPQLMQVHLVDTNMTVFPDGLMQPGPPQDLSLYLYHTNLSSLPNNVGEAWKTKKPWRYIRIERSELTTIPESISQAPIEFFSVVGNHIKRFPENIFATQTFTVLQLSQNPLVEIPASIGDTQALGIFMADDTNVSGLPPWFQDWYTTQKVVSLRGSPFCASDTDGISPLCQVVSPGAVFAFRYDLVVRFRPL